MRAGICGPCDVGAHDLCGTCPCCPQSVRDAVEFAGIILAAKLVDAETAAQILAKASNGRLSEIQALLVLADRQAAKLRQLRARVDDWLPEPEWRRRWGQ